MVHARTVLFAFIALGTQAFIGMNPEDSTTERMSLKPNGLEGSSREDPGRSRASAEPGPQRAASALSHLDSSRAERRFHSPQERQRHEEYLRAHREYREDVQRTPNGDVREGVMERLTRAKAPGAVHELERLLPEAQRSLGRYHLALEWTIRHQNDMYGKIRDWLNIKNRGPTPQAWTWAGLPDARQHPQPYLENYERWFTESRVRMRKSAMEAAHRKAEFARQFGELQQEWRWLHNAKVFRMAVPGRDAALGAFERLGRRRGLATDDDDVAPLLHGLREAQRQRFPLEEPSARQAEDRTYLTWGQCVRKYRLAQRGQRWNSLVRNDRIGVFAGEHHVGDRVLSDRQLMAWPHEPDQNTEKSVQF